MSHFDTGRYPTGAGRFASIHRSSDVLEEVVLQIAIRHGKVEVSPTLRAAVLEKVGRVGRFYDGIERAEVRFAEEHNPRISAKEVCEVTVHGHGHVVRARAAATDAFAAVDEVVDKLEIQITKLKGKLIGRSHPRRPMALATTAIDPDIDSDADL
ncbi:MAG TPA: ribosome-associated translation inhibitor RaiA [Acidimicrobiales bacterium]